MSKPAPLSARDVVRTVAPKLIELTEPVLFEGDVWERPGLSSGDRSLMPSRRWHWVARRE
ncbi:MAG: hypothetical protein U1E97_05690 [Alphaproteobacteria bacterium]